MKCPHCLNDFQPTESKENPDHHKLLRIWSELDEIILHMRPHYCGTPSMDGKYPCWHMWLPKQGATSRKTLKEGIIDFVDQCSDPLL
jgi:hypothetical protein